MKFLRFRGYGVVLGCVASALGSVAVACSDSDSSSGAAPAETDHGVDASAPAVDSGQRPSPTGDACAEITSACSAADLGAGKTHECHVLASDPAKAATCTPEREACLAACSGKAGPLDVAVRFGAVVGTEPFACGKKYANLGAESSSAEPLDLRFYVSDVRLVDEAGADVPLGLTADGAFQSADVALLDFEDKSAACDNGTVQTNDTLRGKVPFGNYKGIVFSIGVPEAQNHTDVATASSPLNLTGLNWGWQLGRIFFASGMRATAAEGGASNDSFFHVGSTGCTGEPADGETVTCSKSNRPTIRFASFRPATNVITLDLRELLKSQKLETVMHGCHSFNEANCGQGFAYLGLDFATGAATVGQTVFSVK